MIERHAHRGVGLRRERLVSLEHVGRVGHLRRCGDAEAGHVLHPLRSRLQRMRHSILHGRQGRLKERGCLVGDAVGGAVCIAAKMRARRIGRRLAVGPLVEGDHGGVEVGHVTRVVEDDGTSSGKERVEVRIRRHLSLLEQAVKTLEDHRLIRREFGVDLGPQRLDIADIRIAHVRRNPVGRRLRDHSAEHRVAVRLDEPGHEHGAAEIGHRNARSRRLALGHRAYGEDLAGRVVEGNRLGARVGLVHGDDRVGLEDRGGHPRSGNRGKGSRPWWPRLHRSWRRRWTATT